MRELLDHSDNLLNRVPTHFHRYLIKEINWSNRLIGIKGARGTGKTTLVLQWLKSLNLPASKATYFTLDDLYFLKFSLSDTVQDYYRQGGKIVVLDEVHKYPMWGREIKNIYDKFADIQIVFTGSSILDITRQEGDLSRRSLFYELHGLSFREYLALNQIIEVPQIALQEIITKPELLRRKFPDTFRPYEFFDSYLKYGYYPFFMEDKEGYHQRLRQLIRLVVESDMAEVKGFDLRNARKLLQLLYIISQQVPFKPNIQNLAEKSQIHRNSVANYLYFLDEARLIKLLYTSGISVSLLQKPEKIFLNNTNLLFALNPDHPEKGTLRETFFINQTMVKHTINQPDAGDFLLDGKYIFEVGGKKKKAQQIKNAMHAYVVKDELEFPSGNAFPLWIFGFLY